MLGSTCQLGALVDTFIVTIHAMAPKLASIDPKARVHIGLIIGACMLLTWALNIAVNDTGVGGNGGQVVDATVVSCASETNCSVTYSLRGVEQTARYAQAKDAYVAGTHLRLTVFEEEPDRAFPLRPVSMAYPIVWMVIAGTVLIYCSVRLFFHWRRQAQNEAGGLTGKGGSADQLRSAEPPALPAPAARKASSQKARRRRK